MQYIGIDLHKKFSQFTIMGEQGEIKDRRKINNTPEEILSHLNNFDEPSQAVIEATFSWGWLADLLTASKIDVVLAHPQKVKAIAASKRKTDKIDADTLAHLLRADLIPEAYYCPKELRETKELLRARASMIGLRTQVKNKIHSLLHKANVRGDEKYTDLFGKQGRAFLESLDLGEKMNFVLKQYLSVLDHLSGTAEETSSEIKDFFENDKIAQFLSKLPGFGYYSSLILSSEIGDIKRFKTAKQLCAYAGLVPSTYQSGDKPARHGKIIQGNKYIRWVLIEAVPKAIKKDKVLSTFHERILAKKGHNKAKVATARKMLSQIWYMLTYEKELTDP